MKKIFVPRGFVALMSVVIISAVLLVVVVTGSLTGFTTRFNILDAELKERSAALVDSCVEMALLRVGVDSSYVGPETVAVSGQSCTIVGVVDASAEPRVFKISASFNNAYTFALVGVDTGALSISSWEEVANF
jgi:hypothetical protein